MSRLRAGDSNAKSSVTPAIRDLLDRQPLLFGHDRGYSLRRKAASKRRLTPARAFSYGLAVVLAFAAGYSAVIALAPKLNQVLDELRVNEAKAIATPDGPCRSPSSVYSFAIANTATDSQGPDRQLAVLSAFAERTDAIGNNSARVPSSEVTREPVVAGNALLANWTPVASDSPRNARYLEELVQQGVRLDTASAAALLSESDRVLLGTLRAFFPDESTLMVAMCASCVAVGGNSGELSILGTDDGAIRNSADLHRGAFVWIEWINETTLLTAGSDGILRRVRLPNLRIEREYALGEPILAASRSSLREVIALSGVDGAIHVLDERTFDLRFTSRENAGSVAQLGGTADRELVLSEDEDLTLEILQWDGDEKPRRQVRLPQPANALKVAGQLALIVDNGGTLTLLSLRDGSAIRSQQSGLHRGNHLNVDEAAGLAYLHSEEDYRLWRFSS